jgi:hypothetical protein
VPVAATPAVRKRKSMCPSASMHRAVGRKRATFGAGDAPFGASISIEKAPANNKEVLGRTLRCLPLGRGAQAEAGPAGLHVMRSGRGGTVGALDFGEVERGEGGEPGAQRRPVSGMHASTLIQHVGARVRGYSGAGVDVRLDGHRRHQGR